MCVVLFVLVNACDTKMIYDMKEKSDSILLRNTLNLKDFLRETEKRKF